MPNPVTVTIPQTTFDGTPKTVSTTVPSGLTTFQVSLDVAQLDPSTPEAQRALFYMELDASYDGGTTWLKICSKFQAGGSVSGDGGTTTTTAYMQSSIGGDPASSTRQVRGLAQTFLSDAVTPGPSFTSSGGQIVAS